MAHLTSAIGEVSQENAKYYQTIPNVFNVSSIYGMPLYVTKNHFLNATEWLQRVDIYNEDKSIHFTEVSEYDDSFVIVEVPLHLYSRIRAPPSRAASSCKIITCINGICSTTIPTIRCCLFFRCGGVAI